MPDSGSRTGALGPGCLEGAEAGSRPARSCQRPDYSRECLYATTMHRQGWAWCCTGALCGHMGRELSLIHISEPTRPEPI
eukprot:5315231-Pyramimonas_sp.AAC.1